MRKFTNIISGFAAMVLIAISCTKEGSGNEILPFMDPAVIGEWHLTETTSEGSRVEDQVDVYLILSEDCTFELYQKSGDQQMRYDKYTGTCSMADGKLAGKYSDGTPWGATYIPTVSGDVLTLATTDLMEVQKYKRAALSDDEKKKANLKTKADGESTTPIL